MLLYFVSNNEFKIKEAIEIVNPKLIEIKPLKLKIDEIQSEDAKKIVEDKALKAFAHVRRPLFVEHTGLYIENFGELPGGLTQIIWDALEADKFCDYFGNKANSTAIAKTTLGYCNGKKVFVFEGSIMGEISESPRGDRAFQWDCVFIPDGYDKTFAELGDEKNNISMRKIALHAFSEHLVKESLR